jgi:putative mRNA 3-end processing factor
MILQDFIVRKNGGFYCQYGDFYLDPMQPVPQAVISHGHGDHATPGHAQAIATAPTYAFMELRFAKMHLPKTTIYGYYEPFQLGEVTLTFIPAGHILGSAQILMEHKGVRYLYTGDLKLQSDETCEPYESVKAEVLITETTFADPEVTHPDPVEQIKQLNSVQANIMLGAYALGKAQRLNALISKYCPGKTVLVHHGIHPIHKIYEHFGKPVGKFQLYNRKAMKQQGPEQFIYLVPPMTFRSYRKAKDVVKVFASGWSHLQREHHLKLFISDHVDWADLLTCIKLTEPKEVWTIHGDGRQLAQYFKDQLPVRII